MGLFDRFKKTKQDTTRDQRSGGGGLKYNTITSFGRNKSMLLSAVYRCVDVISDTIAMMPVELYKLDMDGYKECYRSHPTHYLLSREPSPRMTRFTLIKSLVSSMLLKGNGFAEIIRDDNGDVREIVYIPSDEVTIMETLSGRVWYNVAGRYVPSENMIHILNFTYDGVTGISTLAHAQYTLELSTDSESHARGFFKGGANVSGVLKIQGAVTDKQKEQIRASWKETFTSEGSNGIAILGGNMDFQPVSVNPKDAQLLETRVFNIVDICRFFGVSPVKCFDLSKSSYSTVEATQLAFLTDTIAPLIEKIELEFMRKLYLSHEKQHIEVKFDTSAMLKADKASQATFFREMFNIGVLTPNEIRQKLDLKKADGGDYTYLQVNMQRTIDYGKKDGKEKL